MKGIGRGGLFATLRIGFDGHIGLYAKDYGHSNDRSGLLEEVQYGNGGKVSYAHDDFYRLTGVAYDGADPGSAPRYTYEYGANGQAAVVRDNHLHRSMQTEYDLAERPMQSTLRDEEGNVLYRATLTYDAQNRLETFRERVGEEHHKTAFTYDKDSRVTRMDYDTDKGKVEYAYDSLGRIASRKVSNGGNAYETVYTFVKGAAEYGANATTPLVASIRQGEGANAMNFAYEYDSRGNITSETRNGKVTAYSYDALGQLIRVNDPNDPTAGESGTTWVYEYDRGGNILSKSYHSYTTGTPGVAIDTVAYSYTDNNWKDKLTAYDGQTITYDAIGNPLNDGRRRYEWQAGRQLKKVYVKADLKEGTKAGVDEQTGTVLKIEWSNGNLLDGEVATTQASATVTRCGEDVTDEYAENEFHWTRDSGNIEADTVWNAAHAGMKSITFAVADIDGDVKISCTLTANGATYGSIAVDGNMDASHTPAELDANDVFVIENGNLKVTTSRGNAYVLENGTLKAAGAKLNGSITAQTKLFASQPESIVEFAYNHNKLRTQKKVTKADGTVETTDYTLHGKLLTHLTKGEDEMHFFYDAQNRPTMVEFNGTLYSYVHNFQGDIVGIVDSSGNLVVEYAYDAWGRHLAVGNVTAAYAKLAILNPFRYRGYVYDEETGLYYLRSRYYEPGLSRFVIPDIIIGEISALQSHNTYLYCDNRPMICADPDGDKYIVVLLLLSESSIAFIVEIPDEVKVEIGEVRKTENTIEVTAFVDKKISPVKTEYNTYDFTFVPADRLEEYKTDMLTKPGEPLVTFLIEGVAEVILTKSVPAGMMGFSILYLLAEGVEAENNLRYSRLADDNPSGGVLIVDRAYITSGHFGITEERYYYAVG